MKDTLSSQTIHEIDPSTLTPAMRQYQVCKAQYPDAILFFRMGDFYETFYEDARTIARVLGVALTSRSKGENGVPMAGVPYHAVEGYLHRMIAAGFKVAICEQMESPGEAKGVIRRDVTRLVTPGTLTEDALLDGRSENFIAALIETGTSRELQGDRALGAAAWCDVSTGKLLTMTGPLAACLEELARVGPKELLVTETGNGRPPDFAVSIQAQGGCVISQRPGWEHQAHAAAKILRDHYGVASFAGFGYDDGDPALRAAGAIVAYLHETQKAALEHLRPPAGFARERHLVIDPTSLRSLEITKTMRRNGADGSLLHAIDRTKTPMGSRLLRNWICYPLLDVAAIRKRQDGIAELLANDGVLEQLRLILGDCSDIERIAARICVRRVSPRDLLALHRSLETFAAAGKLLRTFASDLLGLQRDVTWQGIAEIIGPAREIAGIIAAAICDEPASHVRDGNCIRDGFHPELDRLRELSKESRTWLASYQAKLAAETGIGALKVGYNRVFGYYIEVTNTYAEKIPATFIRKQTVKNAERYITPELKQYESEVLTAQERSLALEQELFEGLRGQLAQRATMLQQIAQAAATLDVLCGLADLARSRRYCRPTISGGTELKLIDARHPVVEQTLGEQFVANDVAFAPDGPSLHLITGPNMAGKSTFIRQTALLVIMAQAGSYLPAREATVGIVDRIFTRIGASDDLASSQSTFMVEMVETAGILLRAEERALVILDEIGRGTSTLDGLALAWAIAEHLADTSKCRTLFATHYHELTDLAESNAAVANYNVLVREWEDQVLFMHRIAPGRADKSYGIHVAKLAGVPRSVIVRAKALLGQLTVHVGRARPKAASTAVAPQIALFDSTQQQAVSQLRALDMNRMSPMQAWEALKSLQGMLEEKSQAASGGGS
jgi:DNA mismatch repair protein MutS